MIWLKLFCLMLFALTSWGKDTEETMFLTATLDRGGRVLVATVNLTSDSQARVVTITRFDNQGKIDRTFGDNGHVLIRRIDDPENGPGSSVVHSTQLRVASDGSILVGVSSFLSGTPGLAPARKLSLYRFTDQGRRIPEFRDSSLRLPNIRGGSLAVSENTRAIIFALPVWIPLNASATPRERISSEVKVQAILLRFIDLNDGSVVPEEVYLNVPHQVGEIQDLNLHELDGKVVLVARGANEVFGRGAGSSSLVAVEEIFSYYDFSAKQKRELRIIPDSTLEIPWAERGQRRFQDRVFVPNGDDSMLGIGAIRSKSNVFQNKLVGTTVQLAAEEWATNQEQVSVASTFGVTLGPEDTSSALHSTPWGTLVLIGKSSPVPLSTSDIEKEFPSGVGSITLGSYVSFILTDEQKANSAGLVVTEFSKDLKILNQVILPELFTGIDRLECTDLISASSDK